MLSAFNSVVMSVMCRATRKDVSASIFERDVDVANVVVFLPSSCGLFVLCFSETEDSLCGLKCLFGFFCGSTDDTVLFL